jgi:hypothetical protein
MEYGIFVYEIDNITQEKNSLLSMYILAIPLKNAIRKWIKFLLVILKLNFLLFADDKHGVPSKTHKPDFPSV